MERRTTRRLFVSGGVALTTSLLTVDLRQRRVSPHVRAEEAPPISVALLDSHGERIQPLLDSYIETSGERIEVTALPYAELYGQLNLALTQRSPTYDVVSLEDPWVPQFASFLSPVDRTVARNDQVVALANELACYPIDAAPCGRPWLGDAQFFVSRTKWMTEEDQPSPETWDETVASAEAIASSLVPEDELSAFAISTLTPHQIVDSFLPVLRGCGKDLLDPETSVPQLDTPEALEAIELFQRVAALSPPESGATGAPSNQQQFAAGVVAMMSNFWASSVLSMSEIEPTRNAGPIFCEVQPAQAGADRQSLSGIWFAAIPTGSLQADRAQHFVNWLTSPSTQFSLAAVALPPVYAPVYADDALIDRYPHLPRLLDLMAGATPRSRSPYYPQLELLLATELSTMLDGQQSGEDALRNANIAMREFLAREGVLDS